MLSRRPLQALSVDGASKEIKTTPKLVKDKNIMLKTPSDAPKPRMALGVRNVATPPSISNYTKRSNSSALNTVKKVVSTKPRPPKAPSNVPAARVPFTIFQDAPAKKPFTEDAENIPPPSIRPLADIREVDGKRERRAKHLGAGKAEKAVSVEEQIRAMTCKTGEEPESYWKLLAEERLLALVETLKECETVHAQLDAQKAAYSALEKVAGQAAYFEKIVCDMIESEGVSVLNRSVQTDIQASDFEEAEAFSVAL